MHRPSIPWSKLPSLESSVGERERPKSRAKVHELQGSLLVQKSEHEAPLLRTQADIRGTSVAITPGFFGSIHIEHNMDKVKP
jgi:hypothetical protein